MNGFRFPPPPPPPPKASTVSHEADQRQHAGQERGRGRGRGRGHYNARGRGDRGGGYRRPQGRRDQADSSNHGASSHYNSLGSNGTKSAYQNDLTNTLSYPFNSLPPGSHVNPSFIKGINTPASVQRAKEFSGTVASLPRTAAGHKRKLEALRGPQHEQKRAGPPTAPSVPSFGASIVTATRRTATSSLQSHAQHASFRRPSNKLGLTPGNDDPEYSSSDSDEDDEDIDEEAMYAELGTKLTFEHNGTVMSLNSTADLIDWIRERRKNWPTQRRLTAKLEEKRKVGEVRKRLMSDAIAVLSSPRPQNTSQAASRNRDLLREATTESPEKTSPSRDHVSSLEVHSERDARSTEIHSTNHVIEIDGTEHDDDDGQPASEADGVHGSKATNDSSGLNLPSASLEEDSDASSDDSTDSEPPEELLTKPKLSTDRQSRPLCKYFSASGVCRDGDACQFRHAYTAAKQGILPAEKHARQHPKSQNVRDHGHQLTQGASDIYTLLLEKEQEGEDHLALEAIKFLGGYGLFSQAEQKEDLFD